VLQFVQIKLYMEEAVSLHDSACILYILNPIQVVVSHESGRESVVLKLVNFGNGHSKLLNSSSSSGHSAPEVHILHIFCRQLIDSMLHLLLRSD
jgi:hypothetical protein